MQQEAITIDLTRLSANLSALWKIPVDEKGAVLWLKRQGFEAVGEGRWLPSGDGSVALLESDEVVGTPRSATARALGPNPLDDNLALAVPAAIVGVHRVARRAWRPVARRALQSVSWEVALEGVEFVDIALTPGDIVLKGPSILIRGENVLMYLIRDEVWEAQTPSMEPAEFTAAMRRLAIEGSRYFWFCLSLLTDTSYLPLYAMLEDPSIAGFARTVLRNILRWWPQIVEVSKRFSLGTECPHPWPRWGYPLLSLLKSLGFKGEEIDSFLASDAATAGRTLARWLGKPERTEP